MNTQKGFSLLIVFLLVLVVGVGAYIYTQTEIFNKTNLVTKNKQSSGEVVEVSDSKIVKKEPVTSIKVDTALSDEVINNHFESMKTAKLNWVDIDLGFSKITKGDINGDGYEDVLYIATSCGASCGISLGAIINQKDGTGKDIKINSETYIRSSSALQTGVTDMQINNGVVLITANGFIGEDDWDKSVTKKFKVEDNTLVEII